MDSEAVCVGYELRWISGKGEEDFQYEDQREHDSRKSGRSVDRQNDCHEDKGQ
jgi:hypothetical protein